MPPRRGLHAKAHTSHPSTVKRGIANPRLNSAVQKIRTEAKCQAALDLRNLAQQRDALRVDLPDARQQRVRHLPRQTTKRSIVTLSHYMRLCI